MVLNVCFIFQLLSLPFFFTGQRSADFPHFQHNPHKSLHRSTCRLLKCECECRANRKQYYTYCASNHKNWPSPANLPLQLTSGIAELPHALGYVALYRYWPSPANIALKLTSGIAELPHSLGYVVRNKSPPSIQDIHDCSATYHLTYCNIKRWLLCHTLCIYSGTCQLRILVALCLSSLQVEGRLTIAYANWDTGEGGHGTKCSIYVSHCFL